MCLTTVEACKRCGCCCWHNLVQIATQTDLDMWNEAGRQDILAFLDDNFMWVDPETKEPIQGVCPFLIELSPGLYSCRIYEFRPRVCRTYVPGQNC